MTTETVHTYVIKDGAQNVVTVFNYKRSQSADCLAIDLAKFFGVNCEYADQMWPSFGFEIETYSFYMNDCKLDDQKWYAHYFATNYTQ